MKSSYILVFLMSTIFFMHKYFVFKYDFSPWKGGGFAMYSEPHYNKRVLYSEGIIVSGGKEYKFRHKENMVYPYFLIQGKIKLYPTEENFERYINLIIKNKRYINVKGKTVDFDKDKDPYMKQYKLILYNRYYSLLDSKLYLREVKEYVFK